MRYKTKADFHRNNVLVPAGTELELSDREAKYLKHNLDEVKPEPAPAPAPEPEEDEDEDDAETAPADGKRR